MPGKTIALAAVLVGSLAWMWSHDVVRIGQQMNDAESAPNDMRQDCDEVLTGCMRPGQLAMPLRNICSRGKNGCSTTHVDAAMCRPHDDRTQRVWIEVRSLDPVLTASQMEPMPSLHTRGRPRHIACTNCHDHIDGWVWCYAERPKLGLARKRNQ